MNEDIYTFGMCKICKEKQPELPDGFKDLFGNFGGDK